MELSKFLAFVSRHKIIILLLLLLIACAAFGGNFDNLGFNGNTISSRNTNGNIVLEPNGSGEIICDYCTPSTVAYYDTNGGLQSSSVTPIQLSYLLGATSNIQTQINACSNASNITSGILGVGFGGTGLTSGTSGGVLYFSNSSTIASSSALTQGAVLLGGGPGAAPTPMPTPTATGLVLTSSSGGLTWAAGGGGGSGTVTSVTFTGDGTVLSSTPSSAVTTTGTVTAALNTQSANKVLAGPTTGSAATPTFRSLVGADLPNPTPTTLGGIESITAVTHNFLTSISTLGVPAQAQPAFTDISGTAQVGQGGTGITSGTSGGIPYFSSTSAISSSAALTQGAVLVGGGPGAAPTPLPTSTNSTYALLGTNPPTWGAVTGAGSTPQWTYTAQTSNYSASINNYVNCSSSSFTVTLPTAASVSGQTIGIQHNGTSLTNIYTIATTSSQTINGPGGTVASGNYSLYTNGERLVLMSDGSNWQVVTHYTDTGITSAGVVSLSATSAYIFTIASATVVQGDTYSNNGHVFTVTSSGTVTSMPASGTGAAAASGTLTKVTGSGPTTLTFSAVTTSAPAVNGSAPTNAVSWSRNGRFATIVWQIGQSSAGTAGNGDYIVYLPSSLAIDTTAITPYLGTINGSLIETPAAGIAYIPTFGGGFGATNAQIAMISCVYCYSSTSIRVNTFVINTSGGASGAGTWTSGTAEGLGVATVVMNWSIRVPIFGWQP